MTDKELEERLKLIERDLRHQAHKLCYNNNVDEEDLYQETYLKVWEKREMYKYDDSFRAWCRKLMKHLFIDIVKVENRYKPFFNPQLLDDDNEELFLFKYLKDDIYNPAIEDLTIQDIQDSIQRVIKRERDKIIIIKCLQGTPQSEIALEVNETVNNVKQIYFKGLKLLRVDLINTLTLDGTYNNNKSLVSIQKVYRMRSASIEVSNRKRFEK